jgi:hypothetical protein
MSLFNKGGIVIFKNTKIFSITFVLYIILLFLTSCTSTIIDLYHEDTNLIKVEEGFNLSNPKFENFQIKSVLFQPYFSTDYSEEEGDEYIYTLNMSVYKEANNDSKVTLNKITIEGTKNVILDKNDVVINKELAFQGIEGNMQESNIILLEPLNGKDLKLSDDSKIKVILNISVQKDKKIITCNLEYIFKTDVRTYLIQR